MNEGRSILHSILQPFRRFFLWIYNRLILGVYRFIKAIVCFFINFFKRFYTAAKETPHAFMKGLLSFFVMGLGQFRNKQWYKAVPFFVVFAIFLTIEISTSRYWAAFSEIAAYPAEDKLYFFRDYGGFFTRGIWGFFNLGQFVLDDVYRGELIIPRDRTMGWRSSDNSQVLLGEGVIAVVLMLIFVTVWIASIRDAYHTHLSLERGDKLESYKEYYQRVWDDYFAYILVIPAVVLILFFVMIPFIFSFSVAFTNWTDRVQLSAQTFQWVGFDTFVTVFSDAAWLRFFWDVFTWTMFYAFMSSVTVYTLGMIQALIIESKYVVFKKLWRIILILPWAIPGMISLMLFNNVFSDRSGLMNQILANAELTEYVKTILQRIGLVGQTTPGVILWFSSPDNASLARAIIIIVNLWLGYPYFMMLITGVLGTIPNSLYEAASIDGASNYQKFRFITFPWVLRATAPVIITTFTFNFNNFGAIYFLTGGGPRYATADIPETVRVLGAAPGQTDILISWIYKLTFQSTVNQFNLAATYSILIFLLIGLAAIYNLSKVKSFWEEE